MKARLCSLLLLLVAGTFATAATLEEWIAKGCPSPDREWRARDYVFFKDLLTDKTLPLPRLDSEPGRTVLHRLVKAENLSLYQNTNLPVEMRVADLLKQIDGTRGILVLYAQAANKGEKLEKELAEVQVFFLAVADSTIQVMDEYIPTIPKDERYETRMAGFATMKSGLATVLDGALTSLTERTLYSDASVAHIAAGIRAHYPRFAPLLPASTRTEFRQRVKDLVTKEKNPDVKRALVSLNETMQAEPGGAANESPKSQPATNPKPATGGSGK